MSLAARLSPRWRVVLLDDHERSRREIREAVRAAGGEVVGEAARRADAVSLVRQTGPDVGIFAVGLADGDGVDAAADVMAATSCPVVLFTSHNGDPLSERARAAGVMAYLLKPLRSPELAPALDLAVTRHREARALRQGLEERKPVERAKGQIMKRYGFSEEEAFRRLRRAAMDSRRTIAEIARTLLVSETVTRDVP